MDKTQKHSVEWKKPDTKDYVFDLCNSIYIKFLENTKVETEGRWVVVWGWKQKWGVTAKVNEGTFWGDGNVLKLDYVNGFTTI